MMYQQTEHPAEAELFMQWWSKNQLPLWTEGHTSQIPAHKSFIADATAGDERYQYIVDNYIPIGKTISTFYAGIFPELSEIEGEGVMQTMTQQILQGVAPAPALSQAQTRLTEILK